MLSIIFYGLAALLIWFSFKSFAGGMRYLRFFKDELAKPHSDFAPFVTIVAPCRGVDEGLDKNIASVFEQDYPEYEIIFGIDSSDDPAVPVIKNAIARYGLPNRMAKLVIGSKATASARKVEKMREAVLHANDRSRVFVFVDSDVRPSKHWLRDLVAPLADEKIAVATGYRWYLADVPSFATEMRSVWNASIASALGANTRSNFAWGGSMAVRRDTFERLDIREKWRGILSDDFAITHAAREAGMGVAFVPAALTASLGGCSMSEFLEFTTRQMKITRVYMPQLWVVSFIGSALFNLVMIWSAWIVLTHPGVSAIRLAAAATLTLVTFFSVGKAWLRLRAVRLVLTRYEAQLGRQFWTQTTLWALTPLVFLYNSMAALFSRQITWRGTTYKLKSPTETVIMGG